MNNLLTAIMTKTISSTLFTDVGGRIFLDQAPEDAELPYVVFFIVSAVPDNKFQKLGEDITIQFSLFSSSVGMTEITNMYNDLKALFDECSLTITGNTLIWFRRVNLVTMVDEIVTREGTTGVKHWAVDYEILTEET